MKLTRREFLRLAGLAAGAALLPGCARAPAEEATVSTPLPGETAPRLWQVNGPRVPQLSHLDAAIKGYMQRRRIACGAMAVVWQGRLVLVHAYRWSPADDFQPEPSTPFRIAGLSQSFTALAALRLVQEQRLALETRLVDVLPQFAALEGWSAITLLHLLQHQVGWQFPPGLDPLFADRLIAARLNVPLPISLEHIFQYLQEQPPAVNPGTGFAAQHLDYVLIGRVIEQIAGQPYEQYLQQAVFAPCGMRGLALGHTDKAQQLPGEAPYQSSLQAVSVISAAGGWVDAPYGSFNLENLAASAGWTAAVFELGRWLAGLANWEQHPVLNRKMLEVMFAWQGEAQPGSADTWQPGCGWLRRGAGAYQEHWQTGSLPGTYAMMGRLPEGWAYAAVFNRNEDPGDPTGASYADLYWVIEDALRLTPDPYKEIPPDLDLLSSAG